MGVLLSPVSMLSNWTIKQTFALPVLLWPIKQIIKAVPNYTEENYDAMHRYNVFASSTKKETMQRNTFGKCDSFFFQTASKLS